MMIEKVTKTNEYFKGKLQDQTRKDSINPGKCEAIRMKAQTVLMMTSKLREIINAAKCEIKDEATFFKSKISKNIEISRIKIESEIQKRRFVEQTCERLRRDLSFIQSSTPSPQDFGSNQYGANISFRGTEKDSISKRLGLFQNEDIMISSSKKGEEEDQFKKKSKDYHIAPAEATTPLRKPLSNVSSNPSNSVSHRDLKTVNKGASNKAELDKEYLDLKTIEMESAEIFKRIEKLKNMRENNSSANSTLTTPNHR